MELISFLKKYLRRKKEIRLIGLKAELQSHIEMLKISETFNPFIISDLRREIAELEFKLR